MSGSGQGEYYTNLASSDYYLDGGEPLGRWAGKGALAIGLAGKVVNEKTLEALLQGFDPSGHQLVQNAGDEKRQAGWDLTFSAPKSVSVAWSQSKGEQRKAFQHAHKRAVEKALQYLEKEASFTRRGKGGLITEKAKMVVAMFDHGTSRAKDPALHTHALVMNVTSREDGTTGSLKTTEIYRNKMTAGAIYRAELASRIEKSKALGFKTKREESWFEIKGISKPLRDEFSKRRKIIEEELRRTGNSGAKASAYATLNTREVKEQVSRKALFEEWAKTGEEFGFTSENLDRLRESKTITRLSKEEEKKLAFEKAIEKLTEHQSHFNRIDLVRRVAEEAQGRGLGASDVLKIANEELATNSEIVGLGNSTGEKRYTTKEILELERSMLSIAKASKAISDQTLPSETVQAVLAQFNTASKEQKKAVEHLTQSKGLVKAVTGMAGTGKSYMLQAVKKAYELEGFKVIGTSLSGKASQGLEDSSGIVSNTIHSTLAKIKNGSLHLNSKTMLVVDEAGMVGTRHMESLLSEAKQAGAKVALVGDAKQLQPVNAGGAFKAIVKELGDVKLMKIRRQVEAWARKAVHNFASGDASKGLKKYAKKGLLSISETRHQAVDALVDEWKKEGVFKPEKNLILAGTNFETREINLQAQSERKQAGLLGQKSIETEQGKLFENDRVHFTKNSRYYGVRNGQLGTVISIDESSRKIQVELDRGFLVSIPLENYSDIKLGYAITTHKSQGMTVDNSFILLGGAMQDRELSYVQVSRASQETRLYTDKVEAGEELTQLVSQMSKSRQKDLASDLIGSLSTSMKSERGMAMSIG